MYYIFYSLLHFSSFFFRDLVPSFFERRPDSMCYIALFFPLMWLPFHHHARTLHAVLLTCSNRSAFDPRTVEPDLPTLLLFHHHFALSLISSWLPISRPVDICVVQETLIYISSSTTSPHYSSFLVFKTQPTPQRQTHIGCCTCIYSRLPRFVAFHLDPSLSIHVTTHLITNIWRPLNTPRSNVSVSTNTKYALFSMTTLVCLKSLQVHQVP